MLIECSPPKNVRNLLLFNNSFVLRYTVLKTDSGLCIFQYLQVRYESLLNTLQSQYQYRIAPYFQIASIKASNPLSAPFTPGSLFHHMEWIAVILRHFRYLAELLTYSCKCFHVSIIS